MLYWPLQRQAFKFVSRRGISWLECLRLNKLPWLVHAFSTRRGGAGEGPVAGLDLGLVPPDEPASAASLRENRRRFLERLGTRDFSLAEVRQIHSAVIYQVAFGSLGELTYHPSGLRLPPSADRRQPKGDALLTAEPGLLLCVRSADCLQVLLVDPRHRAVAAVHAGWRGALARVVEKTVGEIRRLFGSQPRELVAAVGPSIRACCYEVGEEVLDAFCGSFPNGEKFFRKPERKVVHRAGTLTDRASLPAKDSSAHSLPGRRTAHLDLVAVASDQLRTAGVAPSNIEVAPFCTACRTDLFFSHRKEGSRTGRMMAVIGIRPCSGGV